MDGRTLDENTLLAMQHHQAGRLDAAELLYRTVLQHAPNSPQALQMLGVLLHQRGKSDEGVELLEKAVSLEPNNVVSHLNMGLVFLAQRQRERAIACFETAVKIAPTHAMAHEKLGTALLAHGKPQEAINSLQQWVALAPQDPVAYGWLGSALDATGMHEAASIAFKRAVALNPNFALAYFNLGNAYRGMQRPAAALAPYRRAIELEPNMAQAHNNLAGALKDLGRLNETIVHYRKAAELRPDIACHYSNLLYSLHFLPEYDIQAIFEAHREYARRYEAPLANEIRPHPNDRSPERRLRIGYVSPDFKHHSMASNLVPLLEGHSHADFEIFCYASVAKPDSVTQRLRRTADVWRDIHGVADADAAELIRNDRIDILVDLTLHLADNRLLVFARKPAPLQVSYLGHPSTTGLSSIDYRITDHYLDPPGMNDEFYSEKCLRLPDCYWCYQRVDGSPDVNALPARTNGYITFGCLNNSSKISPMVIGLWSQILRAVPNSRLLVRANDCEGTKDFFVETGFPMERLALMSWRRTTFEYLKLYNLVDLGLDPYPYNGHSTTCDSLWMGVPVVSLAGRTAVSRGGLSILSNVGMPELVASTAEQYIEIAQQLATDLRRLESYRQTLRERLTRSPITDGVRFARNLEGLYRQIWRGRCGR